MKHLKVLPVFVLSVFALALTACPNQHKSSKGKSVTRVKGDPNIFVKNTAMNGLAAIPADVLKATTWDLDVSGFAEGSAEVSFDKVKESQAPVEAADIPADGRFTTKINGDTLVLDGVFQKSPMQIDFKRSSQGWVISSYSAKSEVHVIGKPSAVILHTSVANDRSSFSLLLQDNTPGKRQVVSLTFTPGKAMSKRMGERIYEYMLGKGIKVGWAKDQPRVLLVCGNPPSPLPDLVHRATKEWAGVLKERLDFRSRSQAVCPPFSDLNTQTFTFTTEWIEIAGENGIAAWTKLVLNSGREHWLDSDIFFLLGEYQEALDINKPGMKVLNPETLANPNIQSSIYGTSLHEIGHFLGLHHQFNGTASIMSYDDRHEKKLHDYDIKAIQHLYE